MKRAETEREYAFRLAEEHRVLAEHYLNKDRKRWLEHRDKAAAWTEYAILVPTLPQAASN